MNTIPTAWDSGGWKSKIDVLSPSVSGESALLTHMWPLAGVSSHGGQTELSGVSFYKETNPVIFL